MASLHRVGPFAQEEARSNNSAQLGLGHHRRARSIGIDGADPGAHALGYGKSSQIPPTRAKNDDLLITIVTTILN
jgi:hypothetical protein